MPTDSMMALIAALAKGDFPAILGTTERHDVDFKLAAYAFDTNKGKWELAKDVPAFAGHVRVNEIPIPRFFVRGRFQ